MAENPFKVGDVVQLKSGGPKMTASKIDGNYVYVVWFNENGSTTTANFISDVLQKNTDALDNITGMSIR